MASSTATPLALKRLKKELLMLRTNPEEGIYATYNERNILEWHFVIDGAPGTPYENGQYYGKLIFPPNYPHAPPSIMLHTKSGRFETGKRICTSMSDFHPESWSPSWTVVTILIGLRSFMVDDEPGGVGGTRDTDRNRRKYATESRAANRKNVDFVEYFPELTI